MNNLERRLINDTARTYNTATPGPTFKCMVYHDGYYTAVGSYGFAVMSGLRGEAQTYFQIKDDKTTETEIQKFPGFDDIVNDKCPDPLWGINFTHDKYFITGNQGTLFVGEDITKISKFRRLRHPFPGHKLRGVAHGESKYIVVGDNGFIMYSKDEMKTWKEAMSKTVEDLHDVIHSMKYFVAVGEKGTIVVSTDGVNWDKPDVPYKGKLHGILYFRMYPPKKPSYDLYLALTDTYYILSSNDAYDWKINTNKAYDNYYDFIHANGLNIPIGYPGFITTYSIGAQHP